MHKFITENYDHFLFILRVCVLRCRPIKIDAREIEAFFKFKLRDYIILV